MLQIAPYQVCKTWIPEFEPDLECDSQSFVKTFPDVRSKKTNVIEKDENNICITLLRDMYITKYNKVLLLYWPFCLSSRICLTMSMKTASNSYTGLESVTNKHILAIQVYWSRPRKKTSPTKRNTRKFAGAYFPTCSHIHRILRNRLLHQ